MKRLLLYLITSLVLCSCNDLVKKDDSLSETKKKTKVNEEPSDEDDITQKKKSVIPELPEKNSEAQILNHIIIHEKGLQLSRAYLSYENESLVSEKNDTRLNSPIYLNLHVQKGWVVRDGKVSIGASEKIESDAGELVIDVPDVFAATSPFDVNKASRIQLKAGIVSTRAGIDHFIVKFRLWDKYGDGEVTGSYKLYIVPEKN